VTAPNVKAPGKVGTGRAREQANTNDVNCPGSMGDKQPDPTKITATLAAQLALRGFALDELTDGSFVVSRWSLVRLLPDVQAVREFAAQMEAH